MGSQEAGANPARSRHCDWGANLVVDHGRKGWKVEVSVDPGVRILLPPDLVSGTWTSRMEQMQ
jgi:hypothetical protein